MSIQPSPDLTRTAASRNAFARLQPMRTGAVDSIEVARATRPRGLHTFVAGRTEGTLLLSRAHARLMTLRNGGGARAQRRDHRAEATRVQLLAGASAASAAIGGFETDETVGPPASAVVSLSMLTKAAPPPARARRARARSLRTEEDPQMMGRPGGGGSGFAHVHPPSAGSALPCGR
jgi:hypothetical protein